MIGSQSERHRAGRDGASWGRVMGTDGNSKRGRGGDGMGRVLGQAGQCGWVRERTVLAVLGVSGRAVGSLTPCPVPAVS